MKLLPLLLIVAFVASPSLALDTHGRLTIGTLAQGSQINIWDDEPDIIIINTEAFRERNWNGTHVDLWILPDGSVPTVLLPPGEFTAILPYGTAMDFELKNFTMVEGESTTVYFIGHPAGNGEGGC